MHPVNKMETAAHISLSSDRAKEIAKSKEEMLSLLHDMPESDYELSLTDIVDKKSSGADYEKEKELEKEKEKEKNLHKGMKAERKRSNSGKSLRCSSDGVLLNLYTPTSLTRSLTTPRPSKTCKMMPPTPSPSPSPTPTTSTNSINYTNRENERILKFMGCWSLLWDRRGNKSKRQNQHQHQPQFSQSQFHNKEEENSKSTKK